MRRPLAVALAVVVAVAACAKPRAPTVTGAQLYAQVGVLQAAGTVTIDGVTVGREHFLTTGREGQIFVVAQVIERCRGGDPTADVDCTLALLLEQRFAVHERAPTRKAVKEAEPEDRSGSALTAIVVAGLGVAATGGLIYGVATCEFPGCKVVFGLPLALFGATALLLLGRD